MTINLEKTNFDDLGNVILQKKPMITCSVHQLEKRVKNKENQVGFWKTLLGDWEIKGIIG